MKTNVTVTKQNGAALVVGLIMLLVMTLLGITSMSSTRIELKIANNLSNHSTAFQTAALLIGRLLVDPEILWKSSAVNPPQTGSYAAGYESADKLRAGTVTMKYSGCRPNAAGSSLTGSGGAAIVQEISAAASVLNVNGDVVGVNRQVSGYKSIAAGCAEN